MIVYQLYWVVLDIVVPVYILCQKKRKEKKEKKRSQKKKKMIKGKLIKRKESEKRKKMQKKTFSRCRDGNTEGTSNIYE